MFVSINTLGYSSTSDGSLIQSKKVIREVNKSDTFSFSLLPGDDLIPLVKTNKCSFVTAYDDVGKEVVFRGRIVQANPRSNGNEASVDVTCEGPLGYLRDSIVYGVSIKSTEKVNNQTVEKKNHLYDIIGGWMQNHNLYVDDELKFDPVIRCYGATGDPSNADFDLLKKSHNFDGCTTLDALTELLEDVDFECMVTWQLAIPHWTLHISPKFGYIAPDPIVSGLNLKSLSEDIDGSDLVTSILPMGGIGYDEKRLMLGPVTMGSLLDYTPLMPPGAQGGDWYNESQAWYAKMYVDNDDLVRKWGRHISVEIFSDIVANSASDVKAKRIALRNKACEKAAKLNDVKCEFDISAYDLYKAGYEIGALTLYNTYVVHDTSLDITVEARLTKQELNYDNILDSDCIFTVKPPKESSVS